MKEISLFDKIILIFGGFVFGFCIFAENNSTNMKMKKTEKEDLNSNSFEKNGRKYTNLKPKKS